MHKYFQLITSILIGINEIYLSFWSLRVRGLLRRATHIQAWRMREGEGGAARSCFFFLSSILQLQCIVNRRCTRVVHSQNKTKCNLQCKQTQFVRSKHTAECMRKNNCRQIKIWYELRAAAEQSQRIGQPERANDFGANKQIRERCAVIIVAAVAAAAA